MRIFGRMDRYVAGNVFGSYLATLVFVVFLWVLFDMLLYMGRYLQAAEDHGLSVMQQLGNWLVYQVTVQPLVFVVVAPFVTVIACMFAISRIMAANEVVPMVFTGRSTMRVLVPALCAGMVSALLMAGVWQFVLPSLSRTIEARKALLTRGSDKPTKTPLKLQSEDGRQRLLCTGFDSERERMDGMALIDMGGGPQDRVLYVAEAADWNPERRVWELVAGERRAGGVHTPLDELKLDWVDAHMVRLSGKEAKESTMLSYSELDELITVSPGRSDLKIAYHYHVTWPLANVVLLLLALPFAVHFERGSKTGRVVLAVMICGAYLLTDLTCQNLGRNGFLHPVVAAWAPMILFSSLGTVMFTGMRS